MKLCKKIKGVVMALAVAALLVVPATAFAAEGDVPTFQPEQVKITKTIQGSPEAPVSGDTFTFAFEAKGRVMDDGTLDADGQPAIANVTSPAAAAMTGNIQTIEFASITWPNNFPRAGVYEYEVTETKANSDNTYVTSKAKYLMRVYVVNSDESTAGTNLKIDKVTIANTADDSGAAVTEQKVDTMAFVNRYEGSAPLNITKKIAGDYADKTKEFKFSVKITVPETMMAQITDTVEDVGSAGETAKYVNAGDCQFIFGYTKKASDAASAATKLDNQANVAIVTNIELGDGDTLSFASLPVGTRYEVIETGETGYTASGVTYKSTTTTDENKTSDQPAAGTSGQNYTISEGANTAVTTNGAAAVVTNTYKEISPTGVLIDNLPYILLIGIPVVALIAWFVVRRRRYAQAA